MVTTMGNNENDSVTSGSHEHRCNCCILIKTRFKDPFSTSE